MQVFKNILRSENNIVNVDYNVTLNNIYSNKKEFIIIEVLHFDNNQNLAKTQINDFINVDLLSIEILEQKRYCSELIAWFKKQFNLTQ